MATLAFLAATLSEAGAQAPLYFPAENYGQPNKSFTESSANQQLEVLMSRTDVFEPVFELESADPFRRIGRAVGMLDLLVRLPNGLMTNTTCTATLIGPNRAITNYHCVPGNEFTVLGAQLRMGFLDRARAPGQPFNVRLPAIEANRALDYAIVEVSGVPVNRYPPLRLAAVQARARQSLYLIHHPAGQPQRLTRVRCQIGEPPFQDGRLVHHCDTLGGSSGALVLAIESNRFVGLHHAGVPDPVRPYNLAIPAPNLARTSVELGRLSRVSSVAMPSPQTRPPFFPQIASAHRPAQVTPVSSSTDPARAFAEAARMRRPVAERIFRDRLANGETCEFCPHMVALPAGTFLMGSPPSEAGRAEDEGPQRRVSIRQFAVSETEVTFDQWAACVNRGGCSGYQPPDYGWGGLSRPVIEVSWNDAQEYVRWLSRDTGRSYRLLSEAEWEYAARAGQTTAYSSGVSISPSQANYGGELGRTQPAASYAANQFGLHDMNGNVWEWVEDCHADSYAGLPTNGSALHTSNCAERVYRGGSWIDPPELLRSALRYRYAPTFRRYYLGFRVARTLN